MPETDPNRQIFKDESGKVVSWNEVAGGKLIDYEAHTSLRRGVDIDASALEGIKTSFNQMKNVPVFAEIGAKAELRVQAQSPLDLFEEAGLAIRLQAIAQLAAGIGLRPTMTIGELKNAVLGLPDMQGAPAELFELLLKEVDISGVVYAQAAIAIMAYANLVATGSFLAAGERAQSGFQLLFETGYGFKVGAGYRGYVEVNFKSPRRLVTRFSGAAVLKIISTAAQGGLSADQMSQFLSLQAPLISAARLAYEIGELPREQAGARSITIILQEGQRWFIERLSVVQDETIRWAALQVLNTLNTQMMENLTEPFKFSGSLSAQVPDRISKTINSQLGRSPDAELSIENLTVYLLHIPLHRLLGQSKEAQLVAGIYSSAFPGGMEESIRAMFAYTGGDTSAETELLQKLTAGLQAFVPRVIGTPSFNSAMDRAFAGNRELGILLRGGLIPALELAAEVTLPYVMGQGNYDRKLIREAVSSVLLTLIGRNVIRIFNGIVMKIQKDIGQLLRAAGDQLTSPAVMNILQVTGMSYMRKPLQAGFREAAGLFSDFVSQKFFDNALKVFTPIEGRSISFYIENLRDPTWVPRADSVKAVALGMLEVLAKKMNEFITKVIASVLQAFLEMLIAQLEKFIDDFFKEQVNRFRDTLMELVRNNITSPLARIIREELANPVIGRLPAEVRKPVEEAIDRVIRDVIGGQLLTPITKVLGQVEFDPEKILEIMSVQNNLSGFAEYIFDEIERQLNRIGFNLPFNLDVPITLPDISGIPGLPSGLGIPGLPGAFGVTGGGGSTGYGGLGSIGSIGPFNPLDPLGGGTDVLTGGSGNPVDVLNKLLNDVGLGNLIPGPDGNLLIPLGPFTLTPGHIVRAIRGAIPMRLLQVLYSNLLQYAGPGIQQLKRITEFKAAIPRILAQFQARRSFAPSIRTSTYDSLIMLRSVKGNNSLHALQVILHYSGLQRGFPGAVHGFPAVSVYLNNRILPLRSFHYSWNSDGGIPGRQPGLLLWRMLTVQDFKYGENVLYTVATDAYGRRTESGTRFTLAFTDTGV